MLNEQKIIDAAIFTKHIDNRRSCNNCKENIPSNIKRLNYQYKTRFGVSYFRLCERCIVILSKECDKKNIAAWEKELEQKALIKGMKE